MKTLFIILFVTSFNVFAESLPQAAGQIQISDTDASVAIARLLKEDKQYQEAINQYRLVLNADPEHYNARLELAQALAGQGDTKDARNLLKGIKLDIKGELTLAAIAETESSFKEAEEIYRKILSGKSDDLLQFKLASVIVWQKRYKEAIPILERLVTTYPADIQLKRHLAQTLTSAGEHDKALELWRATLN